MPLCLCSCRQSTDFAVPTALAILVRMRVGTNHTIPGCISPAMLSLKYCSEYSNLKDDFQSALIRWALVMQLTDDAPNAGLVKLHARIERIRAVFRLTSHRVVCPTCASNAAKWQRHSLQ